MLNPTSSMMNGNDFGFMNNNNPNNNNFNNNKKLPNPANFKIVKCKNFEKGKNLKMSFLFICIS